MRCVDSLHKKLSMCFFFFDFFFSSLGSRVLWSQHGELEVGFFSVACFVLCLCACSFFLDLTWYHSLAVLLSFFFFRCARIVSRLLVYSRFRYRVAAASVAQHTHTHTHRTLKKEEEGKNCRKSRRSAALFYRFHSLFFFFFSYLIWR